jgi:hypothetical protein
MCDLNAMLDPWSGWLLTRATAINTVGQIVGYGWLDGKPRGFLRTPTTAQD